MERTGSRSPVRPENRIPDTRLTLNALCTRPCGLYMVFLLGNVQRHEDVNSLHISFKTPVADLF